MNVFIELPDYYDSIVNGFFKFFRGVAVMYDIFSWENKKYTFHKTYFLEGVKCGVNNR